MEREDLERFLGEMTTRADSEIARIMQDAAGQIRERTEEMERELASFTGDLGSREEGSISADLVRERNRWNLEYRRMVLAAFENFFMNRCRAAADRWRRDARYREWISSCLDEIIGETGVEGITVTIPADESELADHLVAVISAKGGDGGSIRKSGVARDMPGGFRLECPARSVAYDATLGTLLRRKGDSLRLRVRDMVLAGGYLKIPGEI